MKKHSPIEVVDNLKSGQIILSHLEYDEKLNNAIEMHQVKHLLIMRDPRDAIISNYFFIRKNKNHHAHEALSESQSVQHAINRLIRGVHPDSPPMNMVIQGYQDWLQHAKLIYFEDLIGSAKKMQSRRDTAQRIFRFLEVPVDGHCLDSIMENLISPDSPTYRKGVMGEWSQFFSEDNKQVFKEVAGEELIELGYEKDLDW